MFGQEQLQSISLPVHASVASAQYYFFDCNSDGEAVVASSAGQSIVGVNQDKTSTAGSPAAFAYSGVTPVIAAEAIVAGARVATNASGKAITATTGQITQGKALTASTADGDFIRVLLFVNGAKVA